jgi:hypothetical protein
MFSVGKAFYCTMLGLIISSWVNAIPTAEFNFPSTLGFGDSVLDSVVF